MHQISRGFFFFTALHLLSCQHEAKPVTPNKPPAEPKKEAGPLCRSDEDCLRIGNSALMSNDVEKGRAVLEYGCATYPAGGSCVRLGGVYVYDPPKDSAREREVLGASCVEGSFDVCARLSVMYSKGLGGGADPAKAKEAANVGCNELGDAKLSGLRGEACFILGRDSDRDSAKGFYAVGCKLSYVPSCDAFAAITREEEAEAKARADADAKAAAAEAAKKPAGPLPGANLTIGSITADGLEMKDIACKVNGRIGLLGSLVVVSGLGERKSKMDACHKGATETTLHFWQSGGKISKVEAMSEDKKVKACLEKAVTGAPSTMEAECYATVTYGK